MDIRELSCIGPSGKPIHGTAAILHRAFSPNGVVTIEEFERQKKICQELIYQCGYDVRPEDNYIIE